MLFVVCDDGIYAYTGSDMKSHAWESRIRKHTIRDVIV